MSQQQQQLQEEEEWENKKKKKKEKEKKSVRLLFACPKKRGGVPRTARRVAYSTEMRDPRFPTSAVACSHFGGPLLPSCAPVSPKMYRVTDLALGMYFTGIAASRMS